MVNVDVGVLHFPWDVNGRVGWVETILVVSFGTFWRFWCTVIVSNYANRLGFLCIVSMCVKLVHLIKSSDW